MQTLLNELTYSISHCVAVVKLKINIFSHTHLHVVSWSEVEVLEAIIWSSRIYPRHTKQLLELISKTNTSTAVTCYVDTRKPFFS